MTDFNHLEAMKPQADKTAEYLISQIENAPTLVVRHAGEPNKRYWNALIKAQTSRPRAAGRRNVAQIDRAFKQQREDDRRLYATHVVVGWRGVTDRSGAEVSFSVEACLAFLEALPDWLFEDIRNFAQNPEHFTEMVDGEDAAKT